MRSQYGSGRICLIEWVVNEGDRRYNSGMSPQDLLNRLHDVPFKPFRVRLTNNTVIDITDPGLVVVGPTSAVIADPDGEG